MTVEHGWHGVDKLKKPQDIMACWLITASNMLQWWQDRYTEGGNELPEGTPNGIGKGPYKSAIFDDAVFRPLGSRTRRECYYWSDLVHRRYEYRLSQPFISHAGTGGYTKSMQEPGRIQ